MKTCIFCKLKNSYFLNSLLPISLIYLAHAVFFTNEGFYRDYFSPLVSAILAVYATVLAIYNVLSNRLKGNRVIISSMIVFSIINIISCFLTFDGTIYSAQVVLMILINYLAIGLPRTDIDSGRRRKELDIAIDFFILLATAWNIILLFREIFLSGATAVFFGDNRLAGISYNPNRLGFMASIAAMLSLYHLFSQKRHKFLLAFALVYNLMILVLTNCRSAELFTLVVIFMIVMIYTYKKVSTKVFIGIFALLFILSIAVCALILSSRVYNTNQPLFDLLDDISTKRLSLFVAGLKAGFDSPIYGNSYSFLSSIYAPVQMAHNIFIDLFARYGIFSVLAFSIYCIAIIYYSIRILIKSRRESLWDANFITFIFCLSVFIGFLIQHLVDIFIFLSGYSCGNIFFILLTGYLSYYISSCNAVGMIEQK